MEERLDQTGILDLIVRPAFWVKNGIIEKINDSARRRMIEADTPISSLLTTGVEEYEVFKDGCLYLRLTIAGVLYDASVARMGDGDIFILEDTEDRAELQAMALAAQQLRQPLSGIMAVADALYPISSKDDSFPLQDQVARINRGLYQLQRIVCNMSDAYRYSQGQSPRLEIRNICTLLNEVFSGAAALIKQADIDLCFTVPSEVIYTLVDEEKLERAVHNLLSNAMKFAVRGSVIYAQLTRRENMLYLTVQDDGDGIAPELKGSIYSRYLREPGVEDGRYGIGLGMVIIRAAAAVHGGTVLIQHPKDAGTRITMTLPIRQDTDPVVRSDLLRVDYAGEQNHRLLEFSDSLPASAYLKQN